MSAIAKPLMLCPECGGSGHHNEEIIVPPDRSYVPRCETCDGEGTVAEIVACVECAGQGWWKVDGRTVTCRLCSGSGTLS